MFKLPIPSKGELLIAALIVAALGIGAWELLKYLISFIDISVTLN